MASNSWWLRYDKDQRVARHISPTHLFQSWNAASNPSHVLLDVSDLSNHVTTLTVASGCVGVGTLFPASTLDVNGDVQVRGSLFLGTCNATPTLFVSTSGNVGLGTTLPTQKLHVVGGIAVTSRTLTSNLNVELFDGQPGGFYRNANNIQAGILNLAYGGIGTTTLPSNKLLVGNGSNTPLAPASLHWDGANLGVGTTTPNQRLHVQGSLQTTGQYISTWPAASNTAPLVVSSSAMVSNLNVELLAGRNEAFFRNANSVNAGVLGLAFGGIGTTTLPSEKLLVGNGSNAPQGATALHWTGANLGIGETAPVDKLHITQGGIRVSGSGGNAVQIVSNSGTSTAPYLAIVGRRDDTNTSYTFAGRVGLSRTRAGSSQVSSGMVLGAIGFGGNTCNASDSNVYYSASVVGVAEGDFVASNQMPTGISFLTGGNGQTITTTNVSMGNERMRITNTGNVGIGVTQPTHRLDVGGSLRVGGSIVSAESPPFSVSSRTLNSNLNADLLDGREGTAYLAMCNMTGTATVTQGGTGTLWLSPKKLLVGNGPLAVQTPDLLHWDGANLGIGTSIPACTLDVSGSIRAATLLVSDLDAVSVVASELRGTLHTSNLTGTIAQDLLPSIVSISNLGAVNVVASNLSGALDASHLVGTLSNEVLPEEITVTSVSGSTFHASTGIQVGSFGLCNYGSYLGISTSSNAKAWTVNHTTANVGIGTTIPKALLDVAGRIQAQTMTVLGEVLITGINVSTPTANYAYLKPNGTVAIATPTAQAYSLRATWAVGASELHALSDARAKTDIAVMPDAECFRLVQNIQSKHYKKTDTGTYHIGFIAQEVEPWLPNAVRRSPFGEYDDFCMLDYQQMTAVLWGAVRHLAAQLRPSM